MNKVLLIGNLTKDPELTTLSNGTDMCTFNIALSRRYKDNDGHTPVDYFNVVVFGSAAKNDKTYLHKGSKVAVDGTLQSNTYEARDGAKRTSVQIIANSVEFLSTKSNQRVESSDFEEVDDSQELPY